MTPKLILVAAMLAGLVLPLLSNAAADLRHLTAMLMIQAGDDTFDQLDTKRDGYIDRLEAFQCAWVEADFDRIDSDGDGRISREEWLNATSRLLSLTFLQLRRTEDENP
ncbi:MAG TPA: EF-hand domain-containing protein [Rhodocyclaceae bacterium]|jgi:hypothetical protein|nr:EF-hand domain-containing protein [Rhodocyclaceae bacterium]HRQ48136.1 EF-hand domain-containing protein [Rhodocyclaceae bacterium]